MIAQPLGPVVQSFFLDGLRTMKGLRPSSVKSYRDGIKLFLRYVADNARCRITQLTLADLTFERVLSFVRHLEEVRHNHTRTRNQRLALLHTFFEYLAVRDPEMLAVAERVAAIPPKRVPPPETRFLERDEIATLFTRLPSSGRNATRDRALILFLYNTGARVQEAVDLRAGDLDLARTARARLHGKGDKWRTCPLWKETVHQLAALLGPGTHPPDRVVFTSRQGRPMTRFGVYKIVRRHTRHLEARLGRVGPHVFRHTTAVHLLESGVEVNVIRGWLGHVSLDTTNRYAEINIRAKEAALAACEPPSAASAAPPRKAVWKNDEALLAWLASL
ncbi:tyrosine-type recombinase/integrase [Sorangium sp. So ce1389]